MVVLFVDCLKPIVQDCGCLDVINCTLYTLDSLCYNPVNQTPAILLTQSLPCQFGFGFLVVVVVVVLVVVVVIQLLVVFVVVVVLVVVVVVIIQLLVVVMWSSVVVCLACVAGSLRKPNMFVSRITHGNQSQTEERRED